MSHDPRGVDASLFEDPDDDYEMLQRAALNAAHESMGGTEQHGSTPTPAVLLSRLLLSNTSLPAQSIPAASQLLYELRALGTNLGDPQSAYALASHQAFELGRRDDALQWATLIPPSWTPGALQLIEVEKTSMSVYGLISKNAVKRRYNTYEFVRKTLNLLVSRFPEDIASLQQVILLASRYGYVNETTIVNIKHAVLHIVRNATEAPGEDDLWAFWTSFVDSVRSANAELAQHDMGDRCCASIVLGQMYNSVVRALMLTARLPKALEWASRSPSFAATAEVRQQGWEIAARSPEQAYPLERFTYKLLMQEGCKHAIAHQEDGKTYSLLQRMGHLERSLVDRDWLSSSLTLEKMLATARVADKLQRWQAESDLPLFNIDARLLAFVEAGHLARAREALLQSIGREKIWRELHPGSTIQNGHLPSASALGIFQEAVAERYEVPMSSLVGLPSASYYATASATGHSAAYDFLRQVGARLAASRGGFLLWETALLQRCVRRNDSHEAVKVWCCTYPPGAGGLMVEDLVQRAVGFENSASVSALIQRDAAAQSFHGVNAIKLRPSPHATSLILHAIVSLAKGQYERLEDVYQTWLTCAFASAASPSMSTSRPPSDRVDALPFELPPAQPLQYHLARPVPTSYAFDAFLRAFAACTTTPPSSTANSTYDTPMRFGTRRAYQILQQDMPARGTAPSIASWTILLDALAREGHGPDGRAWERTFALASRLGMVSDDSTVLSPLEFEERSESWESSEGAPLPTACSLPMATLATYTALLRGLLAARRWTGHKGDMLDEALRVRRWLLDATRRHSGAAHLGSLDEADLCAEKVSSTDPDEDKETLSMFENDVSDIKSAPAQEAGGSRPEDTQPAYLRSQPAPVHFTLQHVRENEQTQKVLRQVRQLERARTAAAQEQEWSQQ